MNRISGLIKQLSRKNTISVSPANGGIFFMHNNFFVVYKIKNTGELE
jgi:hypothetical protein